MALSNNSKGALLMALAMAGFITAVWVATMILTLIVIIFLGIGVV